MNPNVTVINPTITEDKESKIRVAAYCRVSTNSEDQQNSLMTQMRYYENFLADSETERLVSVYADEGITGTRMDKREEFQRMLKDCRRGKIDRIIVKSISRFARNTKDCLSVLRELKELGISVMFEKENIDTANITDEIMVTIMGGLAQEESSSISKNVRWSIRSKMKNGTVKFHSAPLGYDLYEGNLIINKREAEIVKSIYKMFLSGMGYDSICRELNESKVIKNDKGTKWLSASVRYILTNEKYIGDSLWQKNYNTSMPYRKVRNKGALEKYYINNTHEAIITKEEFEKVQELIEQRKHPNMNLINNYPLSKKIYCGKCGSLFKRRFKNEKSYWICREHYYNAENCQIKQIPEQVFYTAFTAMYNKLKANYSVIFTPMLTQLQELKNKKYGGNKQYIEINKEIAQLKEQTHVLARLKTKGFLDENKYIEQVTEINAKIEKLNREVRKIVRCDDEDEMIEQIKEIASIIENGTDLMMGFDDVMFESLIEKIIVKNQTEFEFNLIGGLKFTENSIDNCT
ncbi:MAG: recombinase family protein [Oscillospiraceae bacterium]|nr:recombinase family protein [Ruminococcus sp.]